MLRLILMRHAEAGFAAPTQADFDRPLTARGTGEARAQAAVLREHNLIPDIVLCSPAMRTSSTWAALAEDLTPDLGIDFELHSPDKLYQAGKDTLLDHLRKLDGHIDIALMIAHNPGVHEAAQYLAMPLSGQNPSLESMKLQTSFAPATLAVFDCHGRDWFDLTHETVTLKHVLPPVRSVF